jgi:hypothetical protein
VFVIAILKDDDILLAGERKRVSEHSRMRESSTRLLQTR